MGCGEGCGEVPKRFSGAWLVFGLLFVFAHEFLARILVRGKLWIFTALQGNLCGKEGRDMKFRFVSVFCIHLQPKNRLVFE